MSNAVTPTASREDDLGKLILRLAVGVLLLLHGIAKIRGGIGWMAGPLGAIGLPAFIGYGVYPPCSRGAGAGHYRSSAKLMRCCTSCRTRRPAASAGV